MSAEAIAAGASAHASGRAARHPPRGADIRIVARRQVPRPLQGSRGAGRGRRAARHAARACRLLRARRPSSAAVVAADDGDSGAGGRRAGDHCRVPAAGAGRARGSGGGRSIASLPRRWRTGDRGAGVRHAPACRASTRSSVRATPTSPRPRRWSRPTAPIDFYAGPSEIVIVAGTGEPSWIAADLIAQAEHDVDARAILLTWSQAARGGGAPGDRAAAAGDGSGPTGAREQWRHRPDTRSTEAIALANRIAPEHLVCDDEARGEGCPCGRDLRRPLQRSGGG